MRPWQQVSLGLLVLVTGLVMALFFTALHFIADCSAACEARGERTAVVLLIGAGVVTALSGAVLAARGRRAGRLKTLPP